MGLTRFFGLIALALLFLYAWCNACLWRVLRRFSFSALSEAVGRMTQKAALLSCNCLDIIQHVDLVHSRGWTTSNTLVTIVFQRFVFLRLTLMLFHFVVLALMSTLLLLLKMSP